MVGEWAWINGFRMDNEGLEEFYRIKYEESKENHALRMLLFYDILDAYTRNAR